MEALVFFSFSISFLIISIQLFRNKWLMLISGYNTMLKEERDKIDVRPYAIADAKGMAATSLLMCVYGINSLDLTILRVYSRRFYYLMGIIYMVTYKYVCVGV